MSIHIRNFIGFVALIASMLGGYDLCAAQAPNPRGGNTATLNTNRATARDGRHSDSGDAVTTSARSALRRPSATASRAAATPVTARSVASVARSAMPVSARASSATASRAAATPVTARSATSVSRAAMTPARSASATVSRAAAARATAVFSDISKIGGGYATCRDAYATCMDQFCANANDKYRRCYCSSRYTEFRNTEMALDQAKQMLLRFQDNNLAAVNLTSDEVSAMYSATEGESAIRNDTSAAAEMLNEIGDLLSGKKKATAQTSNQTTSLNILSMDFTSDIDDIWGGTSDSIFAASSTSSADLNALEGQALYDSATKQCLQVVSASCENDAVLSMARSAYGIMITQDCNAYEKNLDKQKSSVEQTVRQAEKTLRDARLEEYRAHNSNDVNECLDRVRTAVKSDVACGANYQRCMDYTGMYIKSTGEVIYGPQLFQLESLIQLDGSADVLAANPQFNDFLESRKMFATSALDTCRDISDIVWQEFKRAALIEIAQAQDEKIEEVKMSCVSTMKECYDTQSNALKSYDTNTAKMSGAIAAYAARDMCREQVTACAALYGNNSACEFDANGHLTSSASACGLTSLLAFVDSVDDVRIAEGCETALNTYLQEICTPTQGDKKYPWNCVKMTTGDLKKTIQTRATAVCSDPTNPNNVAAETQRKVNKIIDDIEAELDMQMMAACEELDGYWLDAEMALQNSSATGQNPQLVTAFYSNVFGGRNGDAERSRGTCVENTTMIQCLNYNDTAEEATPVAKYDRDRDECVFTDEWYKTRCTMLGNGYYENGVCYVAQ